MKRDHVHGDEKRFTIGAGTVWVLRTEDNAN